jgi:hypothetical protein
MTALVPIILKNWKLAATGLLILAIVAGWGVHRVIVSGLESDLAAEVSAHAVCRANVGTLEGALEASNKAVQRLREDALAKQAEAGKRAQEARERASRDRRREAADDRSGPERINQFFAEAFQ